MASARSFIKSPPGVALIAWILFAAAVIASHFPYRTDPPQKIDVQADAPEQRFYDQAYLEAERQKEEKYARLAREAARNQRVEEMVAGFVRDYRLEAAHVLDVGAGTGILQDQVADYTALDISATAHRYFHKRFVQGDARAMPFPDGEFDAVWSVWVLEHVPNPEQALREMRRVVKPNGLLLLAPAWMSSPLAANGYGVRPYRDFGIGGKIVKATVPIQSSPAFQALYVFPARAIRWLSTLQNKPTAFHYRALTPNYEQYWQADSDAVNSMDAYEAYLWFKSRGDVCLNCGSDRDMFLTSGLALIIRVKPDPARVATAN